LPWRLRFMPLLLILGEERRQVLPASFWKNGDTCKRSNLEKR